MTILSVGILYWYIWIVSALVACSADRGWCRQKKPVLKVCQQGSHHNITEVFIDTVGIPKLQPIECACYFTRVQIGNADPLRVTLSLLNTSWMPNGEQFKLSNLIINKDYPYGNLHVNDPVLLFIKPHNNSEGGACLNITTDVPVDIECKPQRTISPTKSSTVKPSVVTVTQENHVTHQTPEDSNSVSGIVLPIGAGLVLLLVLLLAIILVVRKRRKKGHHQHSDTEDMKNVSVDHAIHPIHNKVAETDTCRKDQQKYEYIDNAESVTNAAAATSALNAGESANNYDYTTVVELSSPRATTVDTGNSTYDSIQHTRPQQKYTDNIYNTFQDVTLYTDTYS